MERHEHDALHPELDEAAAGFVDELADDHEPRVPRPTPLHGTTPTSRSAADEQRPLGVADRSAAWNHGESPRHPAVVVQRQVRPVVLDRVHRE